MSKVLITGGAGFVGYFLADRLSKEDNQIALVDNLARGRMDAEMQSLLKRKNITFIEGDITDAAFFNKLDRDYNFIYHLAAVIGVRNVIENPDKVLYVNAVSTMNLLEFAKNIKGLKKLFFSSTSEIYSGTLKHFGIKIPTDEEVPLTLDDIKSERTTYMLSKMYGEAACFVYSKKYNIPITIGRYHNIYGPRMGFLHVIPEMFIKINKNNIIDIPSPSHTRAMCYIDDGIEMTVRACEYENTVNEILNIGNQEQELSIKELVEVIAEVIGKKVILNFLPDTPGSPARRCPDISKIRELIDFSPRISLREGISKTYEWYRNKLSDRYE